MLKLFVCLTLSISAVSCFSFTHKAPSSSAKLSLFSTERIHTKQTENGFNHLCRLETTSLSAFAVKASSLEENLTEEEATIVRVFRQCGPSVAYVTSFYNPPPSLSQPRSRSRSRRRGRREAPPKNSPDPSNPSKNPRLQSLGSGSGFVVEQEGYLVTNYHVIQRAYQLNQSLQQIRNVTNSPLNLLPIPNNLKSIITNSFNVTSSILGLGYLADESYTPAQVYVRINSSTKYQKAEIVGVKPELDVAVLRITDESLSSAPNVTSSTEEPTYTSVDIGSSSDLLVGQRVVAIGNPFGLDQTVTSGVVSALNREVTGVAGNKIPNCIQTDAAINPGNSGGPLLNSKGELIGVNTAIITTSGSNAGIGFAIPVDAVSQATNPIIDSDRRELSKKSGSRKLGTGFLGITLGSDELTNSIWRGGEEREESGVLVLNVKKDSPGEKGGLVPLKVENGRVIERGDVIVAINGNNISGGVKEVQDDFRKRKIGEKLMLTVEGGDGDKRIVYVTLSDFC